MSAAKEDAAAPRAPSASFSDGAADGDGADRALRIRQSSEAHMKNQPHCSQALTVIVLGASGDLAKKKTYPSLLKLFAKGYLPAHAAIIGYARSNYTDASFRDKYRGVLAGLADPSTLDAFLARCFYARGRAYDDPDAWRAVDAVARQTEEDAAAKLGLGPGDRGRNRVFYFAVPPDVFAAAGSAIKSTCMSAAGWNRMIIEKPFGKDSASSLELGERLSRSFSEDQLYRIDHYLGKEIVQNLMVLRFGNIFLQPLWNRNFVKSVIITFKEDIGTQGRGGYFDGYGIIRDVMQNHLLQIMSLVAMEPPVRVSGEGYANFVRDEKVKVLSCIPALRLEDVVLGQYVADDSGENPGYLEDPTVPEGSVAPTYAMARFAVNNARWAGVPFIMKAGKALNERKCEIRVQFKEPPGSASMFAGNKVPLNELVIRVQPNDAIYFKCNVKTPGFRTIPVETDMDLTYTDKFDKLEVPDAYTRLILDVLRGEQATFVRSDELEAAWSIFTPLLHRIEGERIKPIPYKFGSRGPAEADAMMEAYYERSTNYVWQGTQYGSSVSSL